MFPPDLLPPGDYTAEVLELDTTPRLVELSERLAAATRQNGAWLTEYARGHAAGEPLRYHPNLGLSEAEYQELLGLWDRQRLVVTHRFPLTITRVGDRLRFATRDARFECLEWIGIDLTTGVMETRAGPTGAPSPLPPGQTIRSLGPWEGVQWERSSGDLQWEGDAVQFTAGRTSATGHTVVEHRLTIVDGGTVARQERLVFRFTPAGAAGAAP